jgi:transposase
VARVPTGYSTRCKVCNSPHRAEIEKWCKEEGISTREAARRLADFGKSVSYEAIRRHMIEHFDVRAEAREQYQKSQQQIQQLAQKQLSDIEMLDSITQGEYELHQAVKVWLDELLKLREKPPRSLVGLLAVTAGEVRQQLKQKAALLGNDPISDIAEALCLLWDDKRDIDGETEDSTS